MIPARTLIELYWTRKMSIPDICARLNVGKSTVRRWMNHHGIQSRTKRDAALLSPSEWTPERIKQLKVLWYTKLTCSEIREKLGISYGPRSISAKAAKLGLERRAEQRSYVVLHKPAPEPERSHAKDECRLIVPERSLITFLPESPRLEMEWRHQLAEVRSARQAQGREVGR